MPFWFHEPAAPGHFLGWKVNKMLYSGRSRFQQIEFVETEEFGTALVLDGVMQTTAGDEYIYHEMLAGVPLSAHPNPQRVLILGGGDCGLASTVLQDSRVQELKMVEIDEEVVSLSCTYLPRHTRSLQDPRMSITYQDGAQFLSNSRPEVYDLILVDSTDPDTTAGQWLYTSEFHASVLRALKPGGAYVQHSGTPFYDPDVVRRVSHDVAERFPTCQVYWTTIPTYPGGLFTFTAGSKGLDLSVPRTRLSWPTRWYNEDLHRAAFALPESLKALLPASVVSSSASPS
ncbi:MAG: polyamine aminopropyltransferase [Alicyclobacillus herbarius]|uniref:polyamine aminopropyltransferase n=1 Tax=Alicyclobacillus herbarius TaxID=122960 RepID=UPI00055113E9|nr:polyamine aminopropyltransferase [Alicyclobacillus herbarius]MCL6633066.1 polyamine aminopropyltransferase [Alicyclobacillus herbarius]